MVDTILVTGSNGQLGRSLRALAEKDQKTNGFFVLDKTSTSPIEKD